MLKITFFLLFIINTLLLGGVLYGGFKLVFSKGRYINGLQILLIMLVILGSFYMAFQGGLNCDESVKFLEYQSLMGSNAKLYEINPYEYHSLPNVLTQLAVSLGLLGGCFAYNVTVERKHRAKAQDYLNSEAHQSWVRTLQSNRTTKVQHKAV